MSFDASQFREGLRRAAAAMRASAVAAVDEFGGLILDDAVETCPVNVTEPNEPSGVLKASGHTLAVVDDGSSIKKSVTFDADFAAEVHEDLDAAHEVGEAKFLETPMRARADGFAEFVGQRMEGAR